MILERHDVGSSFSDGNL